LPINVKQAQDMFPLPIPLHIPNKQFIKIHENKQFAETGALTEGTKVVVTDFSLNHYLAQQYNLHLEKYPKSNP
jgi:hypothetical protein